MKLLFALFAVAVIICAAPSCTPVFSCGCNVTVTTSTGADTVYYASSSRFEAYKKEAVSYCGTVFTDSLKLMYLTDRVDCFVNRAPM